MVNTSDDRFKRVLITLSFIFILAASLVVTLHILNEQNSLYNNGNWLSAKSELEMGVGGALEFLVTGTPLAGNSLNLGAWQGLQEVIYRRRVSPKSVKFDFMLKDDAYLVFLYKGDGNNISGIRISLNPHYSNIYFRADKQGGFSHKTKWEPAAVRANKWHTAQVRFYSAEIELYINKQLVLTFKDNALVEQFIGFRGDMAANYIDNVQILETSGSIIKENFQNTSGFVKYYLMILLPGLLILLVVIWLSTTANSYYNGLMVSFSYFLMATVINVHSFYWLAHRYPGADDWLDIDFYGLKRNYESELDVNNRIKNNNIGKKKGVRILFVGGSQTWGCGASLKKTTFVKLIEDSLNRKHQGHIHFECINAGMMGRFAAQVVDYYQDLWVQTDPDMIFINFSNNDIGNPGLAESLKTFVSIYKGTDVKIFFVREPNFVPVIEPEIFDNHEIMSRVGKELGVPVIPMHNYLAERRNDGFLWWDFVHLTDYGNLLFAERILKEIEGYDFAITASTVNIQ